MMNITPNNRYQREYQQLINQYQLKQLASGSDFSTISNFSNQINFALFSTVDCAATFLANECLPCKGQKDTPIYADVMYKDIKNSSCTMRPVYKNEPWNGMGAYIDSLRQVTETMKTPAFQQTVPPSILASSNYQAYKNGVSCLIGNLDELYQRGGDWYNFFHWSTFTDNPDCQALMRSAGRTVTRADNQGVFSLLYTYFFDTNNTVDESKITMDGIYAVNMIDAYVHSASSSQRLTEDPTKPLMQALISVMYRYHLILQNQASRAAAHLTSAVANSSATASRAILPDSVYLLNFYMQTYANSAFTFGSDCRYQGLSSQLTLSASSMANNFFALQNSVMLDMVGQNALSSPIVASEIPLPDPVDVKVNNTDIEASKQVQYLKFGRYSVAARYRKSTGGQVYEGALVSSSSGQADAPFSVSKLTAQIQDNQRAVKEQLDDQISAYNRNMNNLILKRMMLAYVYEYMSVSTMANWRDAQQANTGICPLSSAKQLQLSSVWRTDPRSDRLAQLLTQSTDSSASTSAGTQSQTVDLAVQYNQSMTYWDNLETLRDEAFQLAKTHYMQYLKYKLNELMQVFRASLVLQDFQNGNLVQKGFPAQFSAHDKNQTSYVLVDSMPNTASGSSTSEDGSVDPDQAANDAGVPNATTDDIVKETANQDCCKNV